MTGGERLDHVLVARGLVRSRAQAKEALAAGQVRLDGIAVNKPSIRVTAAHDVRLEGSVDHYVGRAAHKLLAALEAFPAFGEAIHGSSAVDVGASTGGFTQVLLERGASHVVALDVGHGQLATTLCQDSRVSNLEGLNIRDVVSARQLPESPYSIVVSDLSFISLTLALANMSFLLRPDGHLVALIKPQFEVGRHRLGRTGVVTSVEQRRESVNKVLSNARDLTLGVHGLTWSPMIGTHGNHEYLVYLRPHGCPGEWSHARIDAFLTTLAEEGR